MICHQVDLDIIKMAPEQPRLQDKPNEETVYDAIVETMSKFPGYEYIKHVVGHIWQAESPEKLMSTTEKPNYPTGRMTWYVKIYMREK